MVALCGPPQGAVAMLPKRGTLSPARGLGFPGMPVPNWAWLVDRKRDSPSLSTKCVPRPQMVTKTPIWHSLCLWSAQ